MANNDAVAFLAGMRGVRLRALASEFLRYFFASLLALVVDMVLLIVLAHYMHYAVAATISFICGAAVHYGISVAFVFRRRRIERRKLLESLIFFAAGAGALVVNVSLIALCVEFFSAPLPVAKLVAAGGSFVFGYVVRKLTLF